jgi:SAM-dependent methyltransferase
MTIPTTAAPDYSLGADDAERRRLLAQCERHRPDAEHLLDRIGTGPGLRAVDLGCGPLGVLDVLADRAGPSGHVVGVDRETSYLDMAARTLAERDVHGVRLLEADVTGTGLPDGSFDLAHERLVLVNVPRPADVVAEMVRLVRPGGHVAVQDVDWISWTCVPQHPDWVRLLDAVGAAWSGDVRIGRRLPAMLRTAGLVDVQVDARARVYRPVDPEHRLLTRFARVHRERILALGLLGADLDDCVRRLDDHLSDPDGYTLYATLFQAWGRKP